MNKYLMIVLVVCVGLGAALTIAEIWFDFMGPDVFWKALATLAIVFVVTGFFMVVKMDFGAHTKLKDENYLD